MGDIQDFDNPSFVSLPQASARTGYQPYGVPMILVVPHIRDAQGNQLIDSEVISDGTNGLTIYVLEEPDKKTPVAGYDHRGLYDPNYSLYYLNVSADDLLSRKMTPDPGSGATFTFQSRCGTIGTLTYIPTADYYDISDITIPVEQLPPNAYTLVYQIGYYNRTVSDTGLLVCFDTSSVAYAVNRSKFNHPGDVLYQMVQTMPELYLTSSTRANDTTIQFLRPFAEVIQDLHDEQGMLENINWVHNIRPEYVPYLGFLLGWDLPYFPDSIDNLRLAVLRNIVRLQQLKGTKRAVRELFDLFGFYVTINNIWWTPTGSKYVGPGEDASYPVDYVPTVTYEPLILDYKTDGYAAVTVPLINRPSVQSMVIESFLVTRGSYADTVLQATKVTLEDNLYAFNDSESLLLEDRSWIDLSPNAVGVIGYSRFNVDGNGYATLADKAGWPAYSTSTIRMDYNANVLTISSSRYLEHGSDNTALYSFVSYQFGQLVVPVEMQHLQSNRFDIEIIPKDGSQLRADVIDFLIDFLFQVKAFHSLLRKILFTIDLADVYTVTDQCAGGQITQDPNTQIGMLQVPPYTIIPEVSPDRCKQIDPANSGYRPQDIAYREAILAGMNEEFAAWQALGAACIYNVKGQDKINQDVEIVFGASNGETVESQSTPPTVCTPDGNNYCFKGRVQDTIVIADDMLSIESWMFKLCRLTVGSGSYFTLPIDDEITDTTLRYVGPGTTRGLGRHNIAPSQHPSLDIIKYNLTFPGCRLARLGNLTSDFISPIYNFRPWDFQPLICPPSFNDALHTVIVIGVDGQQYLSFDAVPYKVSGNGIAPDINNLGNHVPPLSPRGLSMGPTSVVHQIYSQQATNNLYVTLEGSVDDIGVTEVSSLLFASGATCGGVSKDYSDGYPAVTGYVVQSGSDTGTDGLYSPTEYFPSIPDAGESNDLRVTLGIPDSQPTPNLLFTTSSQITVPVIDVEFDDYQGWRLDCGCVKISCDGTNIEDSVINCSISQFISDYGELEPDQIEIISTPTLVERLGISTLTIDGTNTLFQVRQTNGKFDPNGTASPAPFPPNGSFSYKDTYDVIYDVMWDTVSQANSGVDYVDFVTVKKDPRIPGKADHDGSVRGKQLYFTGLITTTRLLYNVGTTSSVLVASGEEQIEGEYQDSFLCGNNFVNPFTNDLNHSITDDVEALVTQGPHWNDPDTESASAGSTWDGGTGGGFSWIDVFGD
jgi:hypothetical protein